MAAWGSPGAPFSELTLLRPPRPPSLALQSGGVRLSLKCRSQGAGSVEESWAAPLRRGLVREASGGEWWQNSVQNSSPLSLPLAA